MELAYAITVLSFFVLVFLYHITPAARNVCSFQQKLFVEHSQGHYVKVWYILAIFILINCIFFFWQAEGKIPLLHSTTMDNSTEYSVYRAETSKSLNMSLVNINIYILCTVSIFISFVCIRKNKKYYRFCSVALFFISGLFSLSRSFMSSALLVMLYIYVSYKPIYLWRKSNFFKIIATVFIIIGLSIALLILSKQASAGDVFWTFLDRIIFGQWLGLPMYFYYFEHSRVTALTLLHPYILSILGIQVPSTPGRELMEYLSPEGVAAGSAGNIPTFFVGEAYAVAGWWGVGLSILHVALILYLISFVFNRMQKTYFSCCLYGYLVYKFSFGLSLGISAYLFSGLPVTLLCLLIFITVHKSGRLKVYKPKPE